MYFKDAFTTTLQMSAVPWDNKFDKNLSAILLKEQPVSERERDLLSKLIEKKPEPCLARESSEEVTNFILLKKNNSFTKKEDLIHGPFSYFQHWLELPPLLSRNKRKSIVTSL